MNHQLLSIGVIVILLGFAIVFIGALTGSQKSDTKVAVGGFVGFIPFGFANDKRLLYVLLAFMATIFVLFFILPYLLRQ